MAIDALGFIMKMGQSHGLEEYLKDCEAEAWMKNHPDPPHQANILIAGEYYLAVYHYKFNLRALYPISMAAKNVQRDQPED